MDYFNVYRLVRKLNPHFPTEMEFTQALQLLISVSEDAQKRLHILAKFTMEYPRLKVGAKLLPDLIKLYNWLHCDLKYVVEEEYAMNNGLEEIITKGGKKFPHLDLCNLYSRVTGNIMPDNNCFTVTLCCCYLQRAIMSTLNVLDFILVLELVLMSREKD